MSRVKEAMQIAYQAVVWVVQKYVANFGEIIAKRKDGSPIKSIGVGMPTFHLLALVQHPTQELLVFSGGNYLGLPVMIDDIVVKPVQGLPEIGFLLTLEDGVCYFVNAKSQPEVIENHVDRSLQ